MLFNSSIFLVYFLPLFLIGYYLVDRDYKNLFLLVASGLFYAYGAPLFIFVIIATTLLDFYLVRRMDALTDARKRKLLMWISVGVNLGLLAYFKYTNFFIDTFHSITGSAAGESKWVDIALPLGISFYTFETITYVMDVYRGVHKPLTKFSDYLLYILFFPKLIAGPIVRYHEIADQLHGRRTEADDFLHGFYRFVIGLLKKVLIADLLSPMVAAYFRLNVNEFDTMTAWLIMAAFLMQVYYDFSAYSDMAIGLARMVGFRLPENFNHPFTSGSVTEFWRRWHISLGNWFRNYLYIPLGGSKGSRSRTYFNLVLVFFICGLWHGAEWSFVLFGLIHGLFLLLERMFLGRWLEKAGRLPGMIYTFAVFVVSLTFFRMNTPVSTCVDLLKDLFGGGTGTLHFDHWEPDFITALIIAFVFAYINFVPLTARIEKGLYTALQHQRWHLTLAPLMTLLFVIALTFACWTSFSPFVYFRF
jgi:alginate O-acetyltransferase complex protein AlgI